jgi:hypothetical protein
MLRSERSAKNVSRSNNKGSALLLLFILSSFGVSFHIHAARDVKDSAKQKRNE